MCLFAILKRPLWSKICHIPPPFKFQTHFQQTCVCHLIYTYIDCIHSFSTTWHAFGCCNAFKTPCNAMIQWECFLHWLVASVVHVIKSFWNKFGCNRDWSSYFVSINCFLEHSSNVLHSHSHLHWNEMWFHHRYSERRVVAVFRIPIHIGIY